MPRAALFAGLIALAVATPALAQNPPCAKRQKFIDHLQSNYDESVVGIGLTKSGRVMEILASSSGSWTIIATSADGVSCGIASGESYEPRPALSELKMKGPPA